YPAARWRFGLFRRGVLQGVAVFSHPCNDRALTSVFPGRATDSVELGRFVLLDEVPGNGETWMLGRCFRLLRHAGLAGAGASPRPTATARPRPSLTASPSSLAPTPPSSGRCAVRRCRTPQRPATANGGPCEPARPCNLSANRQPCRRRTPRHVTPRDCAHQD